VKIKFFFLLGSRHRSYTTWSVTIPTQLSRCSNFIFHAVIEPCWLPWSVSFAYGCLM